MGEWWSCDQDQADGTPYGRSSYSASVDLNNIEVIPKFSDTLIVEREFFKQPDVLSSPLVEHSRIGYIRNANAQ